jgi:hypothetical protein
MRLTRVPPLAVSAAVVAVAAFLSAASPEQAAPALRCSPSQPSPHRGARPFSAASFNYGTRLLRVELPPRGRLVAGTLPDGGAMATIGRDGSITAKTGWWRGLRGRLVVSGQRLDRRADPLRAAFPPPNSYGATGFVPSSLTFPTPGCWRVSARLGPARLSFVLSVTKVRRS